MRASFVTLGMEVIRTPPAVSYNDVSSRDISGTARNHRRRRAVSKQPSESPIKKVANNNTPTIKPKQSKSRNGKLGVFVLIS